MVLPDPTPDPELGSTALETSGEALPEPSRPRSPGRRMPILPVAIALVAILAGGALFMSGYTLGAKAAAEPGTPSSADQAFQPFWEAYHAIDERYAGGTVDRNALAQGAIKGMIEALGDPYSSYLTSDQYRNSLQGISGQFEGIGAQVVGQAPDGTQGCTPLGPTCRLVVVKPIDGSPAKSAGLLAADAILAIDGTSVGGLTVDAAIGKIRGPKGTVVTLSIQRGTAAPVDLKVTRDVVQEQEVDSQVLANGKVGYIRLAGFSDAAATEVKAALKAHVDAGRTKLILDLRGNPGGFITAARTVASQFIGSGVIFWEQDAQGVQTAVDAETGGVATDPGVTVVCLIDGGSASASEIVAGALQDTKRATLVGQTSFGKGTVQQWQELTGEGGAFKLTIARWLTPDKRWIHKVGLTPDVVVTIPANAPIGTDLTLEKALQVLGVSAAAGWPAAA